MGTMFYSCIPFEEMCELKKFLIYLNDLTSYINLVNEINNVYYIYLFCNIDVLKFELTKIVVTTNCNMQ